MLLMFHAPLVTRSLYLPYRSADTDWQADSVTHSTAQQMIVRG
jgi:hypothetical protein